MKRRNSGGGGGAREFQGIFSSPGAANMKTLHCAISGGFDVHDSLHRVCVMGCRLSDV